MHHTILVYIKNMIIFMLFIYTPSLFAVQCAPIEEVSGIWVCSNIDPYTEYDAVLSDINLETGEYKCKYLFRDTGKRATECNYKSLTYIREMDAKLTTIQDDLNNSRAVDFKKNYPIYLQKTDYDLNPNEPDDLFTKINDLSIIATDAVTKLHDYEDTWLNDLKSFVLINSTMRTIQEKSYKYLVQPYLTSGSVDKNKTHNMSRFITGMVTLDSEVVKGYDGFEGDLIIGSEWSSKSSFKLNGKAILDNLKNYYDKEQKKSNTNMIDWNIDPASWVDIFKQKIWGFYYNLQRRLDIGYDILSTQLLFIMMAFFAMSATARGGARYITNRESGMSSGEVKINEASIMKTLGILATVFVFFISVPTTYSSHSFTTTEQVDLKDHEMRTNGSLGKMLIRYAIKQGSFFGTMMADLGTDAFLEFIVKKQGVYTGLFEKMTLDDSIREMAYYYPALNIANECTAQQLSPLHNILAGSKANRVEVDPDHNISNSNFLVNTMSKRIDPDLCQRMAQKVYTMPDALANKINTVLDKVDNVGLIRAEATKNIVENHIRLQQDIGWMNILSVPYTYFLMKYQELFFEETLDFKSLENSARNYVDTLGLRDGEDAMANAAGWSAQTDRSQKRLINSQELAEENRKLTRYAFYNFLPSFSQIKNEIMQRLQALYSDILRLRNSRGADGRANFENYMQSYKNLMNEMMSQANNSYKGPMSTAEMSKIINKIDKDPIQLHMAIQFVSYTAAMATWKKGFVIVFLSAIAMIIGFKLILYVIDVMIHFFVAPFIALWAFTATEAGAGKIKNYLRDTLIYMLYPSIIVIGVFVFIFAYELFHTLYGFIINVLIEGQLASVSNSIVGKSVSEADMAYLSLYSLRDMTELFLDLLSVYVAFVMIFKFPETVLRMLGLGDSTALTMTQSSEKLSGKGGGSVNPLSR